MSDEGLAQRIYVFGINVPEVEELGEKYSIKHAKAKHSLHFHGDHSTPSAP